MTQMDSNLILTRRLAGGISPTAGVNGRFQARCQHRDEAAVQNDYRTFTEFPEVWQPFSEVHAPQHQSEQDQGDSKVAQHGAVSVQVKGAEPKEAAQQRVEKRKRPGEVPNHGFGGQWPQSQPTVSRIHPGVGHEDRHQRQQGYATQIAEQDAQHALRGSGIVHTETMSLSH